MKLSGGSAVFSEHVSNLRECLGILDICARQYPVYTHIYSSYDEDKFIKSNSTFLMKDINGFSSTT